MSQRLAVRDTRRRRATASERHELARRRRAARRRDAVRLELRARLGRRSSRSSTPARTSFGSSTGPMPCAVERATNVVLDLAHRRTSRVRRRDRDDDAVVRRHRRRARSRARRRSAPAPRDPSPSSRIANSSSRDGGRALHHDAPGCERATICISASMWPRCSVCLPVAAAALHVADVRDGERRARRARRSTSRAPRAPRASTDRRRSRRGHVAIDVVGDEQLARVAPQIVDRALRARVALLGAVAERDDPLARCGERGSALPSPPSRRCRRASAFVLCVQRLHLEQREHAEEELPHDREREVALRQLDDAARSDSRSRRGNRRARPRSRPCPSISPASLSSSVAWPIRSSAMFASAMSSSRIGPWPHHSDSRWPSTSRSSPRRSRYWTNAESDVVMSARSENAHAARHLVELRMPVRLVVARDRRTGPCRPASTR